MWILPKSIASAFSAAQQGSTWELSLPLALEAAESSLTWKGKPTPAKSWHRAWTKATWLKRLFGRMSPPSTASRFADWWTSSLAASRVRTSPSPESAPASKERGAVSGSTTSESSRKYSLDWSSLKTSPRSARAGSKSSSAILPRSGTMRSGVLSERPMLERLTPEIAFSLWPTPAARDYKGANGEEHLAKARGHHDQLPNAVALSTLRGQTTLDGAPSSPSDRTLNPRFVEWLMGWPIGWTDCDSQVTEWFLHRPLTLSDNS